jgi:hypothetical protein
MLLLSPAARRLRAAAPGAAVAAWRRARRDLGTRETLRGSGRLLDTVGYTVGSTVRVKWGCRGSEWVVCWCAGAQLQGSSSCKAHGQVPAACTEGAGVASYTATHTVSTPIFFGRLGKGVYLGHPSRVCGPGWPLGLEGARKAGGEATAAHRDRGCQRGSALHNGWWPNGGWCVGSMPGAKLQPRRVLGCKGPKPSTRHWLSRHRGSGEGLGAKRRRRGSWPTKAPLWRSKRRVS